MEQIKRPILPPWLFMLLVVLYDEILLHLWASGSLIAGRLGSVILLALAVGAALALVVSFLGKWGAVVISVLLAVLYLVEYFVRDAYHVFMPLASVLTGAGDVASDFMSVVAGLLGREWWRIAVVLLPVLLFVFLPQPRGKRGWKLRGLLAAVTVAALALGWCCIRFLSPDAAKLTTAYNFNNAVQAFGLAPALALDAYHGDAGEAPQFQTQPTETTEAPTQSTQPLETEATTEATEPPIVYGDNALDLDFAALAESESDESLASIHSYLASLTPTLQNEYTGIFEGKNLILITAEAFSAEVIDPERTPTLYRMATEGVQFQDYYQPSWGGSTTTGEFSNLIGLVPTSGVGSMQVAVEQNLFLTLANQMKAIGYHTAAYHNHTYTYYDRDKTHPLLGYSTWMGIGNGMEAGVREIWPESDLEMMEFTVSDFLDKQPFSVYYMTVSGHALYSQMGNNMCDRHYDLLADTEYSETVKCYLACNMELEYAMESLLRQLEEAGIVENTVIVLATDHYPYGLENSSTWGNDKDYLSELYGYSVEDCFDRDHSALIIWSGGGEMKGVTVEDPVYSLDILPTVSNLFGLDYDSRLLVGRDVFSDAEPITLWIDHSWKTDLASYDASTGTLTGDVTQEYADRISAIVANKINYSKAVLQNKYFDRITGILSTEE